MKLKVVSIKDHVAEVYGVPTFVVNVGAAVRSFGDEVQRRATDDRPNPLNKHPQDFALYLLGTYDDDTGQVENLAAPQLLAQGRDYVSS